jgi:hypothetical protein
VQAQARLKSATIMVDGKLCKNRVYISENGVEYSEQTSHQFPRTEAPIQHSTIDYVAQWDTFFLFSQCVKPLYSTALPSEHQFTEGFCIKNSKTHPAPSPQTRNLGHQTAYCNRQTFLWSWKGGMGRKRQKNRHERINGGGQRVQSPPFT